MITISPQLHDAAHNFGFDAATLPLALHRTDGAQNFPFLDPGHGKVKVYLDLKDWIELAKARAGKPGSEPARAVYEDLRAWASSGDILVSLSASLYHEIAKIGQMRQRTDLAEVIAEISGFATLTGIKSSVSHQMRVALASRFHNEQPQPLNPFGIGVFFAHGDLRRLTLGRTDGGALDLGAEQVQELTTGARVLTEMMFLIGPDPQWTDQLRALGYRPEVLHANHAKRVAHEQQLADMLAADPGIRQRLTKVVYARHIVWELLDFIKDIAPEYDTNPEQLIENGVEWLTAFVDDMPSAAVTVALMDRNFRNSYKAWTGNDLYDADAMAAAIPYCDVVMTDKHVAHQLATAGAVTRSGTLVLSKLSDLHQRLPKLIADR